LLSERGDQQMPIHRRGLLATIPLVAIASVAAADTTDLSLACDTAAAPAMRRAAETFRNRTGVRVFVHETSPGLILPQLSRSIQNDILVTTPARLDAAEQAGLVKPGERSTAWRNRLVLATATSPAGPQGSLAAPDSTPASDIDGAAILQRLGMSMTIGVIDTNSVAWLLKTGGARQGLLHQTEVATDETLRVTDTVPDSAWPPIFYAGTVTSLARRPNPQAFVAFLSTPDGAAALRDAGLEAVA
jgi:ABC-type molybdate transport system substrate-binding protein